MEKKKILIVEDESIISELIKDILEFRGYAIAGVSSSGENAVALAEKIKPDLVLMDISLKGGIDGIEAAKRIKSLNNIPVIFLTAHFGDDILNRAREAGPYGYIIKPFNDSDLYSNIEMALYKHEFEEKIKAAEEKYRSIVDNVNLGVTLLNRDLGIISINRQEKEWFPHLDVSEKPVCYRTFLNPSQDGPCDDCPALKTITDGKVHESIKTVIYREEPMDLRIFTSPVKDRDGNVAAVVEITEDITFKRKLEKEILNISEKERQRIGQDLHDDLGQHLIGTEFRALTLKNKIEENLPVDVSEAERVLELVRQAIQKTRKLARGLCPVELDFNDIFSALEKLASETGEMYNISCRLEYDDNIHINDRLMAANLYHIVQEAVNNSIKHGKADKITISFKKNKNFISLTVTDNGCGMPENLDNTTGLGLNIMKYRAGIIDGRLEISTGSQGTVISCSFEIK